MTIAITGGTGFVGSRLLNQVSEGRFDVRALTRRSMKPRRNVHWVEGALDRPDSLRELVRGTDAIIHVAAVISGRTASDFDQCNVEGTRLLVAAARQAGVRRFIHVSSLAAREPEVSLYGASKAKSEEVVRASGLDYVMVRPPAVYGPGDMETLELFKWAKRGLVMLPPPGKASIIHADDLSRLLLTLAQSETLPGAVYEPDDGSGGLTHQELAQALGAAVGRNAQGLHMPKGALRAGAVIDQLIRGRKAKLTRDRAAYFCHPDWVSDPARAVPTKLWQPVIPLAEGLTDTAEWYRAHGYL
jgi:nucleoside-diphosphate-sugar epimerase